MNYGDGRTRDLKWCDGLPTGSTLVPSPVSVRHPSPVPCPLALEQPRTASGPVPLAHGPEPRTHRRHSPSPACVGPVTAVWWTAGYVGMAWSGRTACLAWVPPPPDPTWDRPRPARAREEEPATLAGSSVPSHLFMCRTSIPVTSVSGIVPS